MFSDLPAVRCALAAKMLMASMFFLVCVGLRGQVSEETQSNDACGPKDPKISIELQKDTQPASVETGNATLVFIEDQYSSRPGLLCIHCEVEVVLGMDGRWITGTRGFSHSVVTVPAGNHHFCALLRTNAKNLPELFGLQLTAGKTYYLKARIAPANGFYFIDLSQANEDNGKYLQASTKAMVLKAK